MSKSVATMVETTGAVVLEDNRVSERVPLSSVEHNGTGSMVGERETILVPPSCWRGKS
jgi:hypothetical protein